MMNLTRVYNQYKKYFDILAKNKIIEKNSFIFYTDRQSHSNVFGLILPSWKSSEPNYLGGHIHVSSLPFKSLSGELYYNLNEAKLCYQCLMQAYFNTALDDLADASENWVVIDKEEFSKDFIYILQKYAEFVKQFPDSKSFWQNKHSAMNAIKQAFMANYIDKKTYDDVQNLGNYYAMMIGYLCIYLPKTASLEKIITSLMKTKIPTITMKPNKYGFANTRLDVLAQKNQDLNF